MNTSHLYPQTLQMPAQWSFYYVCHTEELGLSGFLLLKLDLTVEYCNMWVV